MGKSLKYVKEFDFSTAGKMQGDAYCKGGRAHKAYAEGGKVDKADMAQDKRMIAAAVHKHERAQHPGEPLTKLKRGGILEKATGERYPSRSAMVKHEMMETPRMQREELVQKARMTRDPRIPLIATPAMKKGGQVVKGKAMGGPFEGSALSQINRINQETTAEKVAQGPHALRKGGKFEAKVGKVMGEFKAGDLHSGKSGKIVTNPKQAIAISLSEARKATKK